MYPFLLHSSYLFFCHIFESVTSLALCSTTHKAERVGGTGPGRTNGTKDLTKTGITDSTNMTDGANGASHFFCVCRTFVRFCCIFVRFASW